MEVKKEHKRSSGNVRSTSQFVWLISYIAVASGCLVAYFFLRLNFFYADGKYHDLFQKGALAGSLAAMILTFSKILELIIIKKARSKYKRYNLIRITRLISLVGVCILLISFLFANWYAAAVSLGLFSLILGFALQTPISSFIGWIYIIIRSPYRIGDRIQLDTFKGDVVEINYLDTTLWEFAGDYLTNDLPSGRLIRFPNSLVFQSPVFNYSWHDFHFIWNEISFHVAYESDLELIEKKIKEAAKKELGEKMQDRIQDLKKLVKESPIEETEIKEFPFVSLRINPNTWVEATVTYLVPPQQAASVRTRIIKRVLGILKEQPERTMFPKSNSR